MWRRLCTSFHSALNDLCHSLAKLAERLCTDLVDPCVLGPFTACCLVALDKDPGVRPICILHMIRDDIQEVIGSIQLCAGQTAGVEAAIHATRLRFSSEETEGVLLVDASNAFNSLNWQAALHNIQKLCPAIATILINTYRDSAQLFVDCCTLFSQEGTTHSDPLGMPMYAIATLPLIHRLNDPDSSTSQLWYADDSTATGSLSHLRSWWDKLVYGYHANPSKTWLVTKQVHLSNAVKTFQDSHVNITATAVDVGVPKLGNCLEMYTCTSQCPICAQHVYKLGNSLYTGATAWPLLVHWRCIHAWALAWAHMYISKQFLSLGTPTFTAVCRRQTALRSSSGNIILCQSICEHKSSTMCNELKTLSSIASTQLHSNYAAFTQCIQQVDSSNPYNTIYQPPP